MIVLLFQEEKKNIDLKNHVQSFLQGGNKPKRVKSRRGRDTDTDQDCSDSDRRSRATTPGKALLEEVNLKPPSERKIKGRLEPQPKQDSAQELKNHFRDFMRTPATVKRGRSFSQPRDKDAKNNGKEETSLSRKESFNEKYTREDDQVKKELENHAKRFLQRRSLIKPHRHSDQESDNDSMSASLHKTGDDTDYRDRDVEDSSSEEDIENSSSASNNNIVDYKPPPYRPSSPYTPKYHRENDARKEFEDFDYDSTSHTTADRAVISAENAESKSTATAHLKHQNNVRPIDRVRSKSAVVPPTSYDSYDIELNVEQMLEESWGPGPGPAGVATHHNGGTPAPHQDHGKTKSLTMAENNPTDLDIFNGGQTAEKEKDDNNFLNSTTTGSDRHRIRKYNVYSNSEYVYLDANTKIGNSKPRPFTLSHHSSQDNDKKSFSRQNSTEYPDSKYLTETSCDKDGGKESNRTNVLQATDLLEKSYSKMYLGEDKENRKQQTKEKYSKSKHEDTEELPSSSSSHNLAASFTARTTEILNACKNDIKKLTYRKIYMRTRSDNDRTKSKSVEKEAEEREKETQEREAGRESVYTKYSSGSRIPNRPTTPGPYLSQTESSYTPHSRPTTPGPFTRESWKRTNKKFNYTHLNKYSSHETFV